MAIEYDLKWASELEPKIVLDFLAEKLGFEWYVQSHLIGRGLIVGALKCQGFGQSWFEEAYGFRPTIRVWFRLDKFADQNESYRTIMEAVSILLSQSNDDAVLVFNGEITVLQRIRGELVLDSKWNPSPPNKVTLPYQVRPLASPLL